MPAREQGGVAREPEVVDDRERIGRKVAPVVRVALRCGRVAVAVTAKVERPCVAAGGHEELGDRGPHPPVEAGRVREQHRRTGSAPVVDGERTGGAGDQVGAWLRHPWLRHRGPAWHFRRVMMIDEWRELGSVRSYLDDDVFVIDLPAVVEAAEPVLVLHGFPTSSYDWQHALDVLRARRRVVLLDYPGYGLSAKPDRAYSLFGQADIVEACAKDLGLRDVALVTHDVGDSIGGEILAARSTARSAST